MTARAIPGMLKRCAAFAAIAAGTACSGELNSSVEAVTVRDSAGIRIVENRAPAWSGETAWRIGTDPLLVIGQAPGDDAHTLYSVSSVTAMASGELAVAIGSAGEVRFFDSKGKFLRSLGRLGVGPGEFQRAHRALDGPGGTLQIWDGYAGQITYFSASGEFVRRTSIPYGSGWSSGSLVGGFPDGTLIFRAGSPRTFRATGPYRDSVSVVRFDPRSQSSDTLLTMPGLERYYVNLGDVGGVSSTIFGRSSMLVVRSSSIVIGENNRFELHVLDRNGSVEEIILKDHENVPATPDVIRRVRDQLLQGISPTTDPSNRRRLEQAARDVPVRTSLPAFAGIRTDSEDNIWVLKARFPWDEGVTWHVFDRGGRWLGDLELPRALAVEQRFSVMQIGADFLLGTIQDELDVTYVAKYPLIKP